MRLFGIDGELIPWSNIDGASVKNIPEGKPQTAAVFLKDKQKNVQIGGVSNVFPKREDVERFVDQVVNHIRFHGEGH